MFWTNAFPARVILGGGLLALAACGGAEVDEPASSRAEQAPVRVAVVPVEEVEWPQTFEAPGTVRARTTATLSSRAMGYIGEIGPREGDRVEAGVVIATLEAPELDVSLQQAQAALAEAQSGVPEADSAIASADAQLALAQTTFERMRGLLEKRSVSQQEFDEADAKVKVAQSGKEMAEARRRQLDQKIRQAQEAIAAVEVQQTYLTVKAPFSGRITARRAEPGMLASPGMPLLDLERDGGFRLEVAVPESRLGSVRVGQTAQVVLDALDAPVAARVDEIVPEIDPASRSFIAKLSLPGRAGIRGGLFGRAVFSTGTRQVLVVAAEGIREQGQLRSVMVAEDGVARTRIVRTGEEQDGTVEVLSGLVAGDPVIAPLPVGLADGQAVEVEP